VYVPEGRKEPEAGERAATPERFPVIVFSHGLGGSRANYGYVCEHLASHGYLVIVPTHHGSDTRAVGEQALRRRRDRAPGAGGFIQESTSDPENLKNRPADVSFVLDRVEKDERLGKIADMARVGVAGHSFGAYTAMVEGGMEVNLPGKPHASMRDPRVKAVLPMSPEGKNVMGIDGEAWDHFATPVLFLTGTRDYGQGARSAAWRREGFDAVKKAGGKDAYLVVLEGAGHMTFGRPAGEHRGQIKGLATAFLDAYVKEDEKARAWLRRFAGAKHEECEAEFAAGR
jgi:predicted dienelactone hydrolase